MNWTKKILILFLAMLAVSCSGSSQAGHNPNNGNSAGLGSVFIPPGKLIKDDGAAFKATDIFGPLILKEGSLEFHAPLPLGSTCSVENVVDSRFIEPKEFLRWLQKRMGEEQKAFIFDSNNSPAAELHVVTRSEIILNRTNDNEAEGSVSLDAWTYTFHLTGQWHGTDFTTDGSEWTYDSIDGGPETTLTSTDCL